MTEHATELELRKTVTVPIAAEEAFDLFTSGIATWWPLRTHSVEEADAETVVFEGRVGGRVVERARDGAEHVWGTVVEWEPPARLLLQWHPGRESETAQEVTVTFTPEPAGTRVELVHRGWERAGAAAERLHASYDTGWDAVLVASFGAAAHPTGEG